MLECMQMRGRGGRTILRTTLPLSSRLSHTPILVDLEKQRRNGQAQGLF